MDAFADELEACLAELESGDEDTDATMVVPGRARARGGQKKVSRWPLGITLLAVLALAAIAVGLLALRGDKTEIPPGANPAAPRVSLEGVGAYDPFGDNTEHDQDAPNATDGSPATAWSTETYRSFTKQGVGLLLDAGRPVEAALVRVQSDTPGFTAQIRAGNTAQGPFHAVSAARTVTESTSFALNADGAARYYVVWITKLPPDLGYAHLNEVRAVGA
jgi:hypothetical protein